MKKKTTRKKIESNPPKAIWGALLGTATNIYGAMKEKELAQEQIQDQATLAHEAQTALDRTELEDYKQEGLGVVDYYQAKGGKLSGEPIKGIPLKDANKTGDGLVIPRTKVNTGIEQADVTDAIGKVMNKEYKTERAQIEGARKGDFPTIGQRIPHPSGSGYREVLFNDEVGGRSITRDSKGNQYLTPSRGLQLNQKGWDTGGEKPMTSAKARYFMDNTINPTVQAKGGKLANMSYNTRGGDLEDVSSDMQEVKGNKHSESTIDNTSGVKLNNGKQDIAEVEDGEVIKDNRMVFSDQSTVDGKRTYAEVAKELATKKGELEEGIINKDSIGMKTARRKVKAIDRAEDALFTKQEAEKGNNVQEALPKGQDGLDLGHQAYKDDLLAGFKEATKSSKPEFANTGFGKAAGAVAPYIDNITNALITANAPKVPKPTLVKPRNLETTVNVNPQLAAVKDAVTGTTKSIQENTSNSNVARNAIASAKLQGAKQTGQILSQKENQEMAARNANVRSRLQVDAVNAGKLDKFGTDKMARQDAMQQRTSANLANISDDITDARNFKAAEAYNKERLDVARQTGDVKGTSLRADLSLESTKAKLLTDPTYAQELLEQAKGDKAATDRINEILRKR